MSVANLPKSPIALSTKLDRWLVNLLWLLLVAWVALTFDQYGISNDEYVQHTYGQLLLDWYRSGFTDTAAFHFRNLYLYGGLFDLLAAWLEPRTVLWVWDCRHLLSALFGLLGFYAVAQYARLLGGERLAWIAMLGLFLTVSWSGAMYTHTKDIPFAACMTWALYATVFVVRDLEAVPRKHLLLLGLAVGGAMGLRVGGAFAVIYLVALIVWRLWRAHQREGTPFWARLLRMAWVLLPAGGLAFVIMAICWPWSVMDAHNILEAVKSFSHFDFSMQTMDNGVVYNIGDVPRSYLFDYFVVKLPEVMLLGLLLLPVSAWCQQRSQGALTTTQRIGLLTLFTGLVLPLLFVIQDHPALYNGVRHFSFLLPLVVLLGSLSLYVCIRLLWQCARLKHLSAALVGVAMGLVAVNVSDIAALYPYEYVRINRLGGSPQAAQYRWEGDYWSIALREVSAQLMAYPLPHKNTPYLVAACVDTPQIAPYLDRRFQVTREWDDADFYLATTHMHCHEVMKGKLIGEVRRLGMQLAVLKDRRALQGVERYGTPAKN